MLTVNNEYYRLPIKLFYSFTRCTHDIISTISIQRARSRVIATKAVDIAEITVKYKVGKILKIIDVTIFINKRTPRRTNR